MFERFDMSFYFQLVAINSILKKKNVSFFFSIVSRFYTEAKLSFALARYNREKIENLFQKKNLKLPKKLDYLNRAKFEEKKHAKIRI